SAECLDRLKEFIARYRNTGDIYCFPGFGGLHQCEFCGQAYGLDNLGVPSGDLLFVFPDLIVHYVEQHGYKPPEEFIAALFRSPFPDTEEFQIITEPFWQMHKLAQDRAARLRDR